MCRAPRLLGALKFRGKMVLTGGLGTEGTTEGRNAALLLAVRDRASRRFILAPAVLRLCTELF